MHILHRPFTLIGLVVALTFAAFGQRQERIIDCWQPSGFDITVAFDRNLNSLSSAKTVVDVTVLKPGVTDIDFDFGKMPVDEVRVNDVPARYTQTYGKLDLLLA